MTGTKGQVFREAGRRCCIDTCDGPGGLLRRCRQCQHSMHETCYSVRQKELRPADAEGNNLSICSKKCYKNYWKSVASLRRRWHNDGKRGPTDSVSSEAILVKWLTTGSNYVKYRGYRNDGKRQRNACKVIANRINASGVLKDRTGRDVARQIAVIESQMQEALKVEREGFAASERSEYNKYRFLERLRDCCKYYDVLAPIFKENAMCPLEDGRNGKDCDEENKVVIFAPNNDGVETRENTIAQAPVDTIAEINLELPVTPFTVGGLGAFVPFGHSAAAVGLLEEETCCVWRCNRSEILLRECPQCKRYVHWECHRQHVLDGRGFLKDANDNIVVVCTKRCYDEYQKFIEHPKMIQKNDGQTMLPLHNQPWQELPYYYPFQNAPIFPNYPYFTFDDSCDSRYATGYALSPDGAQFSVQCCVEGCKHEGRATTECQHCKRNVHEECFWESVLVKYQLNQPTDAFYNRVVVCTKHCFDEYQLSQLSAVGYSAVQRSPGYASVTRRNSVAATDHIRGGDNKDVDESGGDSSQPDSHDAGTDRKESQVPPLTTEVKFPSAVTAEVHALLRKCCVKRCNRGGILQECQYCKSYIHTQCYQDLFNKHKRQLARNGNGVVFCTMKCANSYRRLLCRNNRIVWHDGGKRGPAIFTVKANEKVGDETNQRKRRWGKVNANDNEDDPNVTETESFRPRRSNRLMKMKEPEVPSTLKTSNTEPLIISPTSKTARESNSRKGSIGQSTVTEQVLIDENDNANASIDDESCLKRGPRSVTGFNSCDNETNQDSSIQIRQTKRTATTEENLQLPATRHAAAFRTEPSEDELDASRTRRSNETRQTKRMRTEEAPSRNTSGNTQTARVDAALSTVARPRNIEHGEIERLRVRLAELKHEWAMRQNNLRERDAFLDIHLKKIEITKEEIERDKQQLEYRMDLYSSFKDLRQRHRSSFMRR